MWNKSATLKGDFLFLTQPRDFNTKYIWENIIRKIAILPWNIFGLSCPVLVSLKRTFLSKFISRDLLYKNSSSFSFLQKS